jgi:trigger factor
MPAGHPHAKLRGKKAIFKLELKDLKQRVLPEADDEFAKDLGEFETLDALKQDIRQRLEKSAKEQHENAVAEQLVLALVEKNPIPVPPSLVERQARITEQEILGRARSQGGNVSGLGDELRSKVIADAEVKVRAGLLMAEIAKKEGIKIGEEDIEKGLAELAEQSGKNIAKVRAEYRDAKRREMLIGMILENKVLDIIEAKAKIEDAT